jgi:hypothetical protein
VARPEQGAPEPPLVAPADYWRWQHERYLWTTGPLAAADGYRECLNKHQHVDDGHRADADDHALASQDGVQSAIAAAEVIA